MTSFYSPEELKLIPFQSIGENVLISRKASIYSPGSITIGSNVRVDDFCILSVAIYAVSDDYSGRTMTNPTIPDKFKQIQNEPVTIGKHVIIGTGCTVLPGVFVAEGTALGAMSLCKTTTKPWMIYCGIPAKVLKDRKRKLLKLEKEYLNEHY